MSDAVDMSSSPSPADRAGSLDSERVIAAGETLDGIGQAIGRIVLERPRTGLWHGGLAAAFLLAVAAFAVQGSWNAQGHPDPEAVAAVVRAMDVVCYDTWFGIACGGLLVAAILRLAEVEWRCAVTRIAETVAVLAACAALGLSILRPGWFWAVESGLTAMWPVTMPAEPRAILVSDATGLAMFLVVASCVWAAGLLPDMAALRDTALGATGFRQAQTPDGQRVRLYGWLAASWRGSAGQWQGWVALTRTLALLAMILCAALQAGAAVRVAAIIPRGGSGSLLPVTLLVGAVLSGTGLIAAIVVAIRAGCRLQGLVTERHLDILARMMLVFGLVSLYCHVAELGATLLNGDEAARADLAVQLGGDAAFAYWTHVACGLVAVQLFWLRRVRSSGWAIGLVGLLTVIGTLADRMSLVLVHHAPLDAAARGAAVQQGLAGFLGALGIVLVLLLVCMRVVPILSIAELRALALSRNPGAIIAEPSPQNVVPGRFPRAATSQTGIVQATFASDRALAAAIRMLAERRIPARFSACGPTPMPQTAAMLRMSGPAIGDAALAGSLIGGFAFFAFSQWDIAVGPSQERALGALAWPFLVLPSFAFAAMAATLAALLAFGLDRILRADRSPGAITARDHAAADRFVLAAAPLDGDGDPATIERQLAGIAQPALRPIGIAVQWQASESETPS